MDTNRPSSSIWQSPVLGWADWSHIRRSLGSLAIVVVLLCLGGANIVLRAAWHEVEDGVLWVARPDGVVAAEIADGTPAAAAGVRRGDVLLQIDTQLIEQPSDVVQILHARRAGNTLTYTLLRQSDRELLQLKLAPVPQGNLALYFVLAGVGIFTLLVGTSVWLRRVRDQAAHHFFWLAIAFFGVLTFSFSGRLDRLDWVFYWGDAISVLVLPPLFLHFTLVFPDRPRSWARSPMGVALLPGLYVPAVLLGAARVVALVRAPLDARSYVGIVGLLDRVEPLYLAIYFVAGFGVLVAALTRVRSVTARRQLRWIVWGTALGAGPFAVGYALPFALGFDPSLAQELTAVPLSLVPLAFASAIVRYRLMDVEVIIKRALVYAAAVAAIAAIYAVLLRLASAIFLEDSHQHNSVIALLATLVVVLLSRPVKNGIQSTFDRVFYRDRYDYRRALVGFARDLNADLDLGRLSERLVARVMETLLVDRMALLLADERSGDFVAISAAGFAGGAPPPLPRLSALGGRLLAGQSVALDDPATVRALPREETDAWREHEAYYFIPCVSKEGTTAVLVVGRKGNGEGLTSEDVALLATVAGQVATALENGRLYQQLRQTADEVERMREFNESILESLDVGLIVVDVQDRIVRWNRALERMYGVDRAEAVGQGLDELFDAPVVQALRTARRERPSGATLYRLSLTTRVPGQDRLLVNMTTVPLQAAEGVATSLAGTIVIIDDVTLRAELEEQLQISDKMASIGLLAAGVAHEVNTPLTGISSFTQMLLESADPDDPQTRVLEKIERQTFRAAKIVNGLLNLSRPATAGAERAPVDLNAVISDVLALLEHQFKVAKIRVRRDLASPSPVVMGIEFKLQQVFLNLFLNARDAMPKGGWLSIATRTSGEHAVAEVSDTGSGIPSEHLSRIYDPFFTTKAIGQGTGLGLSISYGIIREHDGSISCDSALGEGTRFTLSLPLAASASHRSTRKLS